MLPITLIMAQLWSSKLRLCGGIYDFTSSDMLKCVCEKNINAMCRLFFFSLNQSRRLVLKNMTGHRLALTNQTELSNRGYLRTKWFSTQNMNCASAKLYPETNNGFMFFWCLREEVVSQRHGKNVLDLCTTLWHHIAFFFKVYIVWM